MLDRIDLFFLRAQVHQLLTEARQRRILIDLIQLLLSLVFGWLLRADVRGEVSVAGSEVRDCIRALLDAIIDFLHFLAHARDLVLTVGDHVLQLLSIVLQLVNVEQIGLLKSEQVLNQLLLSEEDLFFVVAVLCILNIDVVEFVGALRQPPQNVQHLLLGVRGTRLRSVGSDLALGGGLRLLFGACCDTCQESGVFAGGRLRGLSRPPLLNLDGLFAITDSQKVQESLISLV